MLNKIAVEFVPEGVTAEEARRAREQQRKTLSKRDVVMVLLAVTALVAMIAAPAWWFWPRQTTATEPPVVAAAPVILPTHTPIPAPTPTLTPTLAIPTSTPPLLPTMAVVTVTTVSRSKLSSLDISLFSSPIVRMTPTVVTVTAAVTPAVVITTHPQAITVPLSPPTPTYRVLLNASHVESNPGASYHISGWIVERDGHTPRPVQMALDFPTGSMAWPRPGMTDVANGYYEFLVEPGNYTLRIVDDEPFALPVVISPTGPLRQEISIQYNGERPIEAAYSQPWNSSRAAHPTSIASSPVVQPTATPVRQYAVYLPIVLRQAQTRTAHPIITAGTHKIFLPLVSNGDVLTGSLQIRDLVNY